MFIDLRNRSRVGVAVIALLLTLILCPDLPGGLAASRAPQKAAAAIAMCPSWPGMLSLADASSAGASDPERWRLGPASSAAGGTQTDQPDDLTTGRNRASGENGGGGGGGAIWRTLGALAVVVGLVAAGRAVLVRLGVATPMRSAGQAVQVLGAVAVGHRQQVLLMRVGTRVLVVGQTGQSLRTLAQLDDPAEVADLLEQIGQPPMDAAAGRRFAGMLARLNQGYQQPEGKP